MNDQQFVALEPEQQERYVEEHFHYEDKKGWYSAEHEFAGKTKQDVIAALIDLEYAEINSIGDCMTGFCVTPPKLADFVRGKVDE